MDGDRRKEVATVPSFGTEKSVLTQPRSIFVVGNSASWPGRKSVHDSTDRLVCV
jgi:hypothetical protein